MLRNVPQNLRVFVAFFVHDRLGSAEIYFREEGHVNQLVNFVFVVGFEVAFHHPRTDETVLDDNFVPIDQQLFFVLVDLVHLEDFDFVQGKNLKSQEKRRKILLKGNGRC